MGGGTSCLPLADASVARRSPGPTPGVQCILQPHAGRYERLEQLLELCYPNTPLRPSPEELRELFKLGDGG